MSDHGDHVSDGSYETPVPELDDHRLQSPTVPRADRPRRGTFDSLYGAQHNQENQRVPPLPAGVRIRDFEEAVVDEDAADMSPASFRSRRPTAASVSPPNSVKAFAEARRRERTMSVSDHKADEEGDLHRAVSVASRHSLRSRPHTLDNDAGSMDTNKSAEEDVCFPLQEEHTDDNLHIDFDYLENFMRGEEEDRMLTRRPSAARVFPDLRPESTRRESAPAEMITADGDFLMKLPAQEKESDDAQEKPMEPPKAVPHVDPNRFSFFSSAWESTIHAADFTGLVLPGEDIRGLFTFPKGETDGVWWLNVNMPTEEEVRAICRAFGIHPLTIEDITTQESREKIELFPSYYFACFRSFNIEETPDGVDYEPFHIYVVVFREGTMSFSFTPNSHASSVRKRITMLKDYVALSSDWICYALM